MNSRRNVKLFTATRHSKDDFLHKTLLGRSLGYFPAGLLPRVVVRYNNMGDSAIGLGEFYNQCMNSCDAGDIAIFVHDDVYFHSWYLVEQVREAVQVFDVIGIAGSQNPDLAYPSWGLKFKSGLIPDSWQSGIGLSGTVSHFSPGEPQVSYYGVVPARCMLLDGLFLAMNVGNIREKTVSFDPQFRFHCYDIDFCRTANLAGLTLGTWTIPVTHASGGKFDSDEWRDSARRYLEKWQ